MLMRHGSGNTTVFNCVSIGSIVEVNVGTVSFHCRTGKLDVLGQRGVAREALIWHPEFAVSRRFKGGKLPSPSPRRLMQLESDSSDFP